MLRTFWMIFMASSLCFADQQETFFTIETTSKKMWKSSKDTKPVVDGSFKFELGFDQFYAAGSHTIFFDYAIKHHSKGITFDHPLNEYVQPLPDREGKDHRRYAADLAYVINKPISFFTEDLTKSMEVFRAAMPGGVFNCGFNRQEKENPAQDEDACLPENISGEPLKLTARVDAEMFGAKLSFNNVIRYFSDADQIPDELEWVRETVRHTQAMLPELGKPAFVTTQKQFGFRTSVGASRGFDDVKIVTFGYSLNSGETLFINRAFAALTASPLPSIGQSMREKVVRRSWTEALGLINAFNEMELN